MESGTGIFQKRLIDAIYSIQKSSKRPVINRIFRRCVKSVRIRSFSGPHFPVFVLNTEKYGAEKLRIRTLFHAVKALVKVSETNRDIHSAEKKVKNMVENRLLEKRRTCQRLGSFLN